MIINRPWPRVIFKHRDSSLLLCALLCLLGALMHPTIPIKRNIHTYFLIADITQSMNVTDMSLEHQPASQPPGVYTPHDA